jgi:hypothetical protein
VSNVVSFVKGFGSYSLSLWERVGVRVSGCPIRAGVSLILAFSQREKGQDGWLCPPS